MSASKKISFIGPLPPPLGGVAVINQSFQSIEYSGYEVVSFDTAKKIEREDLYSKFKLKSVKRNYQVWKRLKQFIEEHQPDVINIFITSGMSILRDVYFLKKMNRYEIPVIIHFHSKIKGEFALTPKRLKWLSKYFNKYAKKIILLSEHHYCFFVKYFGEEKCEIIENFVNYEDFNNKIINKSNDFLFVGRLSKEKGFFDLLTAVNILKQKNLFCRIQVIGVAPTEEIEMDIKGIICANALEDYFVFNGATFGEAKNGLFKQACCLIFPSHIENSPVVLKEAIAAKLAIVASDINANQLILKAKKNHQLHQVKNPDSLANSIENLILNPNVIRTNCKASESIKDYDKSFAEEKLLILMNTIC